MAKISGSDLNDKQKRFCQEYIVDLNGTQAAIRAGYSEKTAKEQAARLLTNANIEEYIQELIGKRSQRTQVTADMVIRELARIAFADPRRVMDWSDGGIIIRDSSDLSDDDAAIISEISFKPGQFGTSKKIKLVDKLAALDKLGRHLKLFDKDTTDPDEQPVPVKIVIDVVDARKKRDAKA